MHLIIYQSNKYFNKTLKCTIKAKNSEIFCSVDMIRYCEMINSGPDKCHMEIISGGPRKGQTVARTGTTICKNATEVMPTAKKNEYHPYKKCCPHTAPVLNY